MKKILSVVLVVAAILLSGCASRTAPIENINQILSQNYSDNQVKTAIIEAGLSHQWAMTPAEPGVINGHLIQRDHAVDIRITYTPQGYSIRYVGSQNMKASGGNIHRSYNRWVRNLDKDIQLRLAAQAAK